MMYTTILVHVTVPANTGNLCTLLLTSILHVRNLNMDVHNSAFSHAFYSVHSFIHSYPIIYNNCHEKGYEQVLLFLFFSHRFIFRLKLEVVDKCL